VTLETEALRIDVADVRTRRHEPAGVVGERRVPVVAGVGILEHRVAVQGFEDRIELVAGSSHADRAAVGIGKRELFIKERSAHDSVLLEAKRVDCADSEQILLARRAVTVARARHPWPSTTSSNSARKSGGE